MLRPPTNLESVWIHNTLGIAWWVFVLYWLISAFSRKRTERRESAFSRLSYSVPTAFGVYLVFAGRTPFTALKAHILPRTLLLELAGLAATLLGVGLAVWARITLGRNWSGAVTIKEDHELISRGPYARFRHPIYSGLLFAVLGTAFVVNQWQCLIGFAIAVAAISHKAKIEEAFLVRQFGEKFEEHRKRTGFLLPRLGSA